MKGDGEARRTLRPVDGVGRCRLGARREQARRSLEIVAHEAEAPIADQPQRPDEFAALPALPTQKRRERRSVGDRHAVAPVAAPARQEFARQEADAPQGHALDLGGVEANAQTLGMSAQEIGSMRKGGNEKRLFRTAAGRETRPDEGKGCLPSPQFDQP